MRLIEETMDEAAASDDLLAAMRGLDQVKPVPPQRGPAVKDYGEREMDYKDIMSKILKSLSDKDWYELESATRDLKSRSVDEISAMAGGAVEGPASKKKKKKKTDTLIREDDEEIEENMADLAWGPATLKLDPVERDPYYEEEDEIEPLAKRRPGAHGHRALCAG